MEGQAESNEVVDRRELTVRAGNPTAEVVDPVTRATWEAFKQTGPILLGLREFRYALKNSPKFDENKTTISIKRHSVIYGVVENVQRKFLLYMSLDGPSAERA